MKIRTQPAIAAPVTAAARGFRIPTAKNLPDMAIRTDPRKFRAGFGDLYISQASFVQIDYIHSRPAREANRPAKAGRLARRLLAKVRWCSRADQSKQPKPSCRSPLESPRAFNGKPETTRAH